MTTLRAFLHHYDDRGRRTKPAEKVRAMLCTSNRPPILEIEIPDKRTTRFRTVYITIAELYRALDAAEGKEAQP